MSIINAVQQYIEHLPEEQPFSAASLSHLGASNNIRQILSRLTSAGQIAKVSRGTYCRVKVSKYVATPLPTVGVNEVISWIGKKTGEVISVHGAEAVRMLNLSTQMQMKPVYYTTGRSRSFKVGSVDVTLKHVSQKKLTHAGSIEGLVILALWYMGKQHVNGKVIKQIEQSLQPEQFKQVIGCLSSMPSWMANSFYQYQREKHVQ